MKKKPSKKTSSRRKKSERDAEQVSVEVTSDTEAVEEEAVDEEASRAELEQYKRPYAEWTALSDDIRRGLAACGFEKPMPVQSAAIGMAMTGRDMVVQAKTGTGKTGAFGIPLVEQIEAGNKYPQALIMTPTRELAAQVARELSGFAQFKGLNIVATYGGIKIGEQIRALEEGADIVVGTPGRLLDHIRRRTLRTSDIRFVVLDEADEMLSMGFYMEVSTIMARCAGREQLMLFSATIPPHIEGLVRQFLEDPARLMVGGADRRVEGIEHRLFFVNNDLPRPRNLLYLIEHEGPTMAIVFCNTKYESNMIAAYLSRQGKSAEAIHGDMMQTEREEVLEKLSNGDIQFMVATDVAARGIDISGLTHVFNYNFPKSPDVYLHRIGRTGRQGRKGTAISMVIGSDLSTIASLRRQQKLFFEVGELPASEQIVKEAAERHLKGLFVEASREIIEPYLPLAEFVANDGRGRIVMAYLLKLFHEGRLDHAKSERVQNGVEASTPVEEEFQETAEVAIDEPKGDDAAVVEETPAKEERRSRERGRGRNKRESQRDNDEFDAKDKEPTPIRIHVNVGKGQGFDVESFRAMVVEYAEVDAENFGSIRLERNHAFLDANNPVADKIIEAFQELEVGDNSVTAQVARKQPRRR